jgi:hypothetical protein
LGSAKQMAFSASVRRNPFHQDYFTTPKLE